VEIWFPVVFIHVNIICLYPEYVLTSLLDSLSVAVKIYHSYVNSRDYYRMNDAERSTRQIHALEQQSRVHILSV
jgi:hypothetical protein